MLLENKIYYYYYYKRLGKNKFGLHCYQED